MSRNRRPCGVCPLLKEGWCPHLAQRRPPNAPACDFGLHEINKKYYKTYSANRRKQVLAGDKKLMQSVGNTAKLREVLGTVRSMANDMAKALNKLCDMIDAAHAERMATATDGRPPTLKASQHNQE